MLYLFNLPMIISVVAESHHVTPALSFYFNTLETECMHAVCRMCPDVVRETLHNGRHAVASFPGPVQAGMGTGC